MHDMVLAFVVSYKRTHDGNSPSWAEIAEGVGTTYTTAGKALKELQVLGALRLTGNAMSKRRIEVVGGQWAFDAGINYKARESTRLKRIKETKL